MTPRDLVVVRRPDTDERQEPGPDRAPDRPADADLGTADALQEDAHASGVAGGAADPRGSCGAGRLGRERGAPRRPRRRLAHELHLLRRVPPRWKSAEPTMQTSMPWRPTISAVRWLTPPSTWTRPAAAGSLEQLRACGDLGRDLRQEALAAPAGLHGHDHDDVEAVRPVGHRLDRRARADRQAGALAGRPDGGDGGVLGLVGSAAPRRGT